MIIGVPKEIKNNENRVSLTPAGARELVKHGHTVYVQHTAGENSGFPDDDYVSAGAKILPTIEDVYAIAEMIIKVKEPIKPEYKLVRKGQLLFTYFHFACDRELTDAMLASGATCLAYETVVDRHGALPGNAVQIRLPVKDALGHLVGQAQGEEGEPAQPAQGVHRPVECDGLVIPAAPHQLRARHLMPSDSSHEFHTVHNLSQKNNKKRPEAVHTASGRIFSAVPPGVLPHRP